MSKREVKPKRPMISKMTPMPNNTGVRKGWGSKVLKIQFVSQATAKRLEPIARPINKKFAMLTHTV